MHPAPDDEIDDLLCRLRAGDATAREPFLKLVHEELRRIASRRAGMSFATRSLCTTEIVNESFLRLFGGQADWNDLEHFLAYAVTIVKSILVDHRRYSQRVKRLPVGRRVELRDDLLAGDHSLFDDHDMADVLAKLRTQHPQCAQIIDLWVYAGLSDRAIGETLGLSETKVRKLRHFALTWLSRELG